MAIAGTRQAARDDASPGLGAGPGVVLVLGAAVSAVALPFATYVWTLAAFGAAHVAFELRYVDERFGARLSSSGLGWWVGGLLVAVAGVRAALWAGVPLPAPTVLQGALLALAVLVVVPRAARAGAGRGLAVAAIGLGLAAAVAFAPLATLVCFALAHNLTPVGFLAERLHGRDRRRALFACGLVFGMVPLAIATGLWRMPLEVIGATLGAGGLGTGLVSAGSGPDHLGVFVPPGWFDDGPRAIDLFRAAAFLQCMHYAVVLGVLPRLGGGAFAARSMFVWPRRFTTWVVLASVALFVHFLVAFAAARDAYGILAAVHAWIEVPVLLLAVVTAGRRDAPVVVT